MTALWVKLHEAQQLHGVVWHCSVVVFPFENCHYFLLRNYAKVKLIYVKEVLVDLVHHVSIDQQIFTDYTRTHHHPLLYCVCYL